MSNPAAGPDTDAPAGEGLELAQFGAGCFWSVELAFQRLPGVARTEVGYSQGHVDAPTYRDVCGGGTGHSEVVRVHYDPKEIPYAVLLDVFWAKHNPTTLNKQVRHPRRGISVRRPRRSCRRPALQLQGSLNLERVLGTDLSSVSLAPLVFCCQQLSAVYFVQEQNYFNSKWIFIAT
jgi:peptide-methionine (S)-S-oxide reductase